MNDPCYIIYEKLVVRGRHGYWEDSYEVFGNVETAQAWLDNTKTAALCREHERALIGPLKHCNPLQDIHPNDITRRTLTW